ncbi:Hypothetical predicted protein [Pelobates cultripes]|uniref:Uncharacterized protein n=1 Tax=Pelobates cultripes TaxID=61616 RepID=A0AAD1T241_PELCU|nr:Hypothetical predicted protein [Pelobates cultripes]
MAGYNIREERRRLDTLLAIRPDSFPFEDVVFGYRLQHALQRAPFGRTLS